MRESEGVNMTDLRVVKEGGIVQDSEAVKTTFNDMTAAEMLVLVRVGSVFVTRDQ